MYSDWIHRLAAVASRAPSADNSQPWTLRWNGDELTIHFAARAAAQCVFTASSHATVLAFGALMQYVHSALAENSIPARWQCEPAELLGQPYASVAFQAPTDQVFRAPAGAMMRHTNRFAYHSNPLSPEAVAGLRNASVSSNRVVIVSDTRQRAALVRLTRHASEARFCNRLLHEWLIGSLRFTPSEVARGDGLDVKSLGLPVGGKAFLRFTSDWRRMNALNRVGAYKLLALSEVAMLAAAPAIVCIVGGQGSDGTVAAGRLMTRVWSELNQQGIAVQPYYVVTDQINRLHDGTIATGFEDRIAQVEENLRRILELQQGEGLHMMLRVGYPKVVQPVRSRRLPLESILVDTSRSDGIEAAPAESRS
jgi:hypothetical protein